MKTRKLISVVLALTMICSMFLSAVPVSAAEGDHVHAICGETTCGTDHNLDGEADTLGSVEYTALSTVLKANADGTYAGCDEEEKYVEEYLEIVRTGYLPAGNYYLDKDIDLSSPLYISGEVNLCLNGHKLAPAAEVKGPIIYNNSQEATLTLADCNGDDGSFNFTDSGEQWKYDENGAYTVTGGVLTGAVTAGGSTGNGGSAISLYDGNATLHMYGGNIVGNYEPYCGSAVDMSDGAGAFYMYGGTIQGNYATNNEGSTVSVYAKDGATIYGGLIANNRSAASAGSNGIVAAARKVTMLGGEIRDNIGAGVTVNYYTNTNCGFIMQGGSITGNTRGINRAYGTVNENIITLGGDSTKTITITGNGDNLYLKNGNTIAVNELAEDSVIGITTQSTEIPVQISTTGGAYAANFTSDVDGYRVAATEDGGLQLEVKPHEHPVCGATCDGDCGAGDTAHESITWTALTADMVNADGFALEAGKNYYLAEDIVAAKAIKLPGEKFNLCLNGYTLEAATNYDSVLTTDWNQSYQGLSLSDCGSTGKLLSDSSTVSITEENSELYLYGGTIESNGYHAVSFRGTLYMYGGTINSNSSDSLDLSGTLYMYGGTVSYGGKYNSGSALCTNSFSSKAYIYGGNITGNIGKAIDMYGKVYMEGDPEISGAISINDGNGVTENPIMITGALNYNTPVSITDEGIGNTDFTSGWSTYMSSAKPTDYFASTDSSKVVALNTTTNELYLADKTVVVNAENGTVEADNWVAVEGDEVTLTVTPDEGYKLGTLIVTNTATAENVVCSATAMNGIYTFTMPATSSVTVTATFTEIPYSINISDSFANGTVTADVTEATVGTTVNLTVTPDEFYKLDTLTVTDDTTGETILSVPAAEGAALLAAEATYSFTMPASTVTVNATFALDTAFTVKAVVSGTTPVEDRDADKEGMDVYSGDKVYIDVTVNGADYTNADWTLVYDSSKFKYVETLKNSAYESLGYYTLDDTNADGNVLTGKISGVAGNDKKADEFTNGEAVVTYVFEALPQSKEVIGKFNITEAHANNYVMAGDQNNTPALTENVDVTILLVDEDAATQVPTGSIENATVIYNALEQAGNEYVLDALFADATVTYAANADGSAVTDTDGDGVVDADEVAGLTFRTGLPAWKNVGTYTYYVKVSGDGLATIYASATLTIDPLKVTPTVTFAVDPDVSKVTITPVIEGVLDNTYTGTVTVTVNGTDYTFTADKFEYDGESTAVCTESFDVVAPASGTLTANAAYVAGSADNYADGTGSATVDVDKLTADDATVEALEDAIESVFPYDSAAHGVVIGSLTDVTPGTWTASTPVDAYDNTQNPTVTNVGDEKLVKVVFTDSTGVYNDVVVYVVLKVTPAEVVITVGPDEDPVGTYKKAVGADDPDFKYGITVELADGSTQTTLFGGDDLGVELEREPGEAAGTYVITATYVPNANYNVTVIDGKLEIGAPEIGVDGDVKIEVVDLSQGLTNGDVQPDYITGKRLILVYTDLDKAYYGYGDTEETAEKMFDVTAAGYKYVDNNYTDGTYTEDATEYKHVYGIVVDAIDVYAATEDYEKQYLDKVIFLGSDAADAPENIVYDADINLTGELDINDYSMNNGIYNAAYARAAYIRSILKADYNHDKVVDTDDSLAVKGEVDGEVAGDDEVTE